MSAASAERETDRPARPDELRTIRKELGLTQAELAAAADCSQTTVCNWENGFYARHVITFTALANALGYDVVLRRRT